MKYSDTPLSIVVIAVLFASVVAASGSPYIHPHLVEALTTTDAGDYITVSIHLNRQVTDAEKALIPVDQDKVQRRADFVNLYKSVAETSQAPLLEYLEGLQINGAVGYIHPHWITNTIVAEMYPYVAESLVQRTDIDALHISSEHEGTLECGTAWGVTKIGADILWENPYNLSGEGVVVAMADTGCRYTHHDLQDHIWNNADEIPGNGVDDDDNGYIDDTIGWDFAFPGDGGDDNDPYHGSDSTSGHGTHTTGTVGSDGNAGNDCGVAPEASLMIVRVPNRVQAGAEDRYWTAFEYLTANGADVLSMSMGFRKEWGVDHYSWRDASVNMVDAGVVAAIAAGNEGDLNFGDYVVPNNVRVPGDVPEIISVGATDSNDDFASFTARGPVVWDEAAPYDDYPYPPGLMKPDVSAPGVNVLSTTWISDTSYGDSGWSGTSMATPHVGGLAALMLEADPSLTPAQIKQFMMDNADAQYQESLFHHRKGRGRIDAVATIDAVLDKSDNYKSRFAKASSNTPFSFDLKQNHPNPVGDTTIIAFAIPETAEVKLDLFDIKGRKIDTIVDERMDAGEYETEYAALIPTGVYLYRLSAGERAAVKKMVVK